MTFLFIATDVMTAKVDLPAPRIPVRMIEASDSNIAGGRGTLECKGELAIEREPVQIEVSLVVEKDDFSSRRNDVACLGLPLTLDMLTCHHEALKYLDLVYLLS